MAGTVFKYGSNVDTDVILPARYLALYKDEDLAAHCMEDLDSGFVTGVQPGDYIVAGLLWKARKQPERSVPVTGWRWI